MCGLVVYGRCVCDERFGGAPSGTRHVIGISIDTLVGGQYALLARGRTERGHGSVLKRATKTVSRGRHARWRSGLGGHPEGFHSWWLSTWSTSHEPVSEQLSTLSLVCCSFSRFDR